MQDRTVSLAITFDYGQRAAKREIDAARTFCKSFNIEHRVIDLPWLADLGASALTHAARPLPPATTETLDKGAAARAEAVWVPNRNGLFVAVAAAFAEGLGAQEVTTGFNAEEAATFPDNGLRFIEAADRALELSTLSQVKINAPLRNMDKEAIAAKFLELDLDPASFWCCYEGGEKLCGSCESCCRTVRAFRAAGSWDIVEGRFA
jgi:7-cyano-7-deazaguanine synthase